jgi:hypothetical protein
MQRRGVRLAQSAQEESALSALRPQLPSAHPAPTQAAWRSGCGSRARHAPSRRTARVSRLQTARARAGSARWCLRCPPPAPWRLLRRAQRQQRGTATPGMVGVRRAGQRRRERRAWAPGSRRALRGDAGKADGGACAKPPRRAAQAAAPGAPSACIGAGACQKSAENPPTRAPQNTFPAPRRVAWRSAGRDGDGWPRLRSLVPERVSGAGDATQRSGAAGPRPPRRRSSRACARRSSAGPRGRNMPPGAWLRALDTGAWRER